MWWKLHPVILLGHRKLQVRCCVMPTWPERHMVLVRFLLAFLFGLPLALTWRSFVKAYGESLFPGQAFVGPFVFVVASFLMANAVSKFLERKFRNRS